METSHMVDISFIIPAYNASETIVRTLDSISSANEGKAFYEIIVVDDCSLDNTREVVHEYAQTHHYVQLLCQPKNHRQGAARNRGLSVAKGEYVMFVDSDDTVTEGVSAVYQFAKDNKLDAALGILALVENGEVVSVIETPMQDKEIVSGRDFAEKYFSTAVNNYPVIYVWKKQYLIDTNRPFEEDRRYEDGDWCDKNAYFCKNIGFVKQILYHYHHAESVNSTAHTTSTDTLGDWVNMAYRQWMFAEEIRQDAPLFYDKLIASSRHIVNGHFSFRRLTRFSPKQVKDIYARVGQIALDYLDTKGGWHRFPTLCFQSPQLVVLIIAVTHPFASLGRWLVNLKRKLKP